MCPLRGLYVRQGGGQTRLTPAPWAREGHLWWVWSGGRTDPPPSSSTPTLTSVQHAGTLPRGGDVTTKTPETKYPVIITSQ